MTSPSRLGLRLSIMPIQAYAVLKLRWGLLFSNLRLILVPELSYLLPQCAALSTHLSLRRVPPQNMLADEGDDDLERPTCHPTSPLKAFCPPTTLVLNLNVFGPHLQLKNERRQIIFTHQIISGYLSLSGQALTSLRCFHLQLEEEGVLQEVYHPHLDHTSLPGA